MGHAHTPIIVISGSTGSGKGTILHALKHELNLRWVPTHTTRAVRPDDDVLSRRVYDTESTFLRHLARHEFLETMELAGHRYGLLREDLQKELQEGPAVVLELTVEGGMKLERLFSHVLLIYVKTTDPIHKERVSKRHSESHYQKEMLKHAQAELKLAHEHYDYIVESPHDHPEETIHTIKELIYETFPDLQRT